jgi:hypothetical protein
LADTRNIFFCLEKLFNVVKAIDENYDFTAIENFELPRLDNENGSCLSPAFWSIIDGRFEQLIELAVTLLKSGPSDLRDKVEKECTDLQKLFHEYKECFVSNYIESDIHIFFGAFRRFDNTGRLDWAFNIQHDLSTNAPRSWDSFVKKTSYSWFAIFLKLIFWGLVLKKPIPSSYSKLTLLLQNKDELPSLQVFKEHAITLWNANFGRFKNSEWPARTKSMFSSTIKLLQLSSDYNNSSFPTESANADNDDSKHRDSESDSEVFGLPQPVFILEQGFVV